MSARDPSATDPGLAGLRAAWSAASAATRHEIIADLYAPACEDRIGISAVAGRVTKATWQSALATASPAARRRWHAELMAGIPGFEPESCDPIGDFLETRTRRVVGARIGALALLNAYLDWARDHDGLGLSARGLARELHARGLTSIKSSVMQWADVELLPLARGGQ
jgi:hypothetical protein